MYHSRFTRLTVGKPLRKINRLLIGAALLCGATAQAQSPRIGFTRIDYVIAQMPESKQVSNQMAVQQTQAETEAKRLQKEFEDKLAAYQKGGAQLSEAIRKDRETELQGLQTRIQEFSRTAQESLQNKYRQLMSPILTKVQQAIDTVAKQNGFQFVLNGGEGGSANVLYADAQHDITDLVVKRLGITPAPAGTPTPVRPTPAPSRPAAKAPARKP